MAAIENKQHIRCFHLGQQAGEFVVRQPGFRLPRISVAQNQRLIHVVIFIPVHVLGVVAMSGVIENHCVAGLAWPGKILFKGFHDCNLGGVLVGDFRHRIRRYLEVLLERGDNRLHVIDTAGQVFSGFCVNVNADG